MNNIRIGVRLILCFVVVSLLAVVLGFVGFSAVSDTRESLENVADKHLPSIGHLATIRFNLRNVMVAQRTLLLEELEQKERDRQHANIDAARAAYGEATQKYEALPQASDEAAAWKTYKDILAETRAVNDKVFTALAAWEKNRADTASYQKAADMALHEGAETNRRMMDALGKVMAVIIKNAESEKERAKAEVEKDGRNMVLLMILTPLLSMGFGVVLTLSITRPLKAGVGFASAVAGGDLGKELDVRQGDEIGVLADSLRAMVKNLKEKIAEAEAKSREAAAETEKARQAMAEAEEARRQAESAKREGMLQAADRLEHVVEIVTSASQELSAQVEQSSRGSEVQSQRVGETAASMEEMNATVLEVARNASQAAETSDLARSKAEEGARVVGKVVAGIGQVETQAVALKADMGNLGVRAEGIGQIMNVISDIADQTNLLALNAAIEAARAGEAGRGFAVVADEVRKLAEKTMTATKEVGEAIKGIQQGARTSIESVERAVTTIAETTVLARRSGESLGEIVSLVDAASDQVRSIAAASEQQSAASEEINRSIDDINRVSTETSDAMRQSAQAVAELAEQSQILAGLIQEMQSEGGSGPGRKG